MTVALEADKTRKSESRMKGKAREVEDVLVNVLFFQDRR